MTTENGGLPRGWGLPGIWMGCHPATEADIAAFKEAQGVDYVKDETLCGRYDADYVGDTGGRGSPTYEMQNVYPECEFVPPGKQYWIFDHGGATCEKYGEGTMYHKVTSGDHTDNYLGPRPHTAMDIHIRKGGRVAWDEESARWRCFDDDGNLSGYQRPASY